MINGVHFTGGGLTLINPTTGEQHPYYQTAKKIFEYSKTQKTTYNKSFPLTGICQGFELLSFLASGDKQDLLSSIPYVNIQRKVTWKIDSTAVNANSKMFELFEQDTLDAMASDDITFHYHDYGVTLTDYHSTPIKDFFNYLSYDTLNNIDFVT